jgi:hypothetical protein
VIANFSCNQGACLEKPLAGHERNHAVNWANTNARVRAGDNVYRLAGTELFLGMKKVAEEMFSTLLMYCFGGISKAICHTGSPVATRRRMRCRRCGWRNSDSGPVIVKNRSRIALRVPAAL